MPKNIAQRGVIVPKIAPISGRYYGFRSCYGGTNSGTTLTANFLYAVPFFTPNTFTANQIGLQITTAAGAGKLLRLGIYTSTPAGLPDALLADSGALAADTAAPFSASATISQVFTAGLLYWLAFVADGTVVSVSTVATLASLGADTVAQSGLFGGYLRSFTYAALPASWGTPTSYSAAPPNIVVRAA